MDPAPLNERFRSAELSGGDPVVVGIADPAPVGQPLVPGNRLGAGAAPVFFGVENPAEYAGFEEWRRFPALVGFPHAAEGRQHGDARRNDGAGHAAGRRARTSGSTPRYPVPAWARPARSGQNSHPSATSCPAPAHCGALRRHAPGKERATPHQCNWFSRWAHSLIRRLSTRQGSGGTHVRLGVSCQHAHSSSCSFSDVGIDGTVIGLTKPCDPYLTLRDEPASSSVLIAGAGIFGLTAAWELRAAWLDRDRARSRPDSETIRRKHRREQDRARGLRRRPTLHRHGGGRAGRMGSLERPLGGAPLSRGRIRACWPPSPCRPEASNTRASRVSGHAGIRSNDSPASIARPRLPAWSPSAYPDGYLNRRAGWVESGAVVPRGGRSARGRGRIVENTTVSELLPASGPCDRRAHARRRGPSADLVLIAAGAWTPTLLPHLTDVMWTIGSAGRARRCRQRSALARASLPGLGRRHRAHRLVWLPGARERRAEDRSSRQRPTGRSEWTASDAAPITSHASATSFASTCRHWQPRRSASSRLCLYCDTFDGDFWIDHDPDRPGLVVAAGDSGHGFKFAPILGPLIADVVERRPNAWASRFRWRSRGADRREAARAEA